MELRLNSGRIIYLGELRQWDVYEWMWEGLPTKEGNRRILAKIVAENRIPYGEPFMIEPNETPVEYIEGNRYPFGDPASLPRVACVARFRSSVARDKEKDYSGLIVIWFQKEFGLPIEPEILVRLQTIGWEQLATDVEY